MTKSAGTNAAHKLIPLHPAEAQAGYNAPTSVGIDPLRSNLPASRVQMEDCRFALVVPFPSRRGIRAGFVDGGGNVGRLVAEL